MDNVYLFEIVNDLIDDIEYARLKVGLIKK